MIKRKVLSQQHIQEESLYMKTRSRHIIFVLSMTTPFLCKYKYKKLISHDFKFIFDDKFYLGKKQTLKFWC